MRTTGTDDDELSVCTAGAWVTGSPAVDGGAKRQGAVY